MAISSVTIPASTGGLNARDPLDAMPAQDATQLINFFPEPGYVRLRRGYRIHQTVGTSIESLYEYADVDGTNQLIAAAGSKIYECTTLNDTPNEIGTGFTNARWQAVHFRDLGGTKLLLFNGADTPQVYDGTTLAANTFTGITTPANLITACAYKSRLYAVEKDSTDIWYGNTDASSGALTKFPVGAIFQRGGYVQWVSSYAQNSGTTADDIFVICSSKGEILTYKGSYPGGSDWSLAGKYAIASPIGRRSYINTGSDLYALTQVGVVAMGQVLASVTSENKYNTLSNKIGNIFEDYATYYSENFGWQPMIHERGNALYVNVPISTSQQIQIVQNVITGAWCIYKGMNANCWCVLNEKPYFGSTDGKIYQADYEHTDNNANIVASLKTAFNYVGSRARMKRFTMIKPLITTNTSSISFSIGVNVDFEDREINNVVESTVASTSPWDTSPWDVTPWGDSIVYVNKWYTLTGLGRCGSFVVGGSFNGVELNVNAFQVNFDMGGVL